MTVPAPAGLSPTGYLKSHAVWRVLQREMPGASLDGWCLHSGC